MKDILIEDICLFFADVFSKTRLAICMVLSKFHQCCEVFCISYHLSNLKKMLLQPLQMVFDLNEKNKIVRNVKKIQLSKKDNINQTSKFVSKKTYFWSLNFSEL